MGLMRFNVYPTDRINQDVLDQAYLSGIDRTAWLVRVRQEDNQLLLERSTSESANLHIPWDVPSFGRLVLSTGSLMERPAPYLLPLELARGKLGMVRNQLSDWLSIGLTVPEALTLRLAEATRMFGRAAVAQDDPAQCADLADQALRQAVECAFLLAALYTEQALAVRRRNNLRLPGWLAGDLGVTLIDDFVGSQFTQTFNAACVPVVWREIESAEGNYAWGIFDRQIEWCQSQGLKVYAGPLVQLDRRTIPDWMYVWDGEYEDVADFVLSYVRQVVLRYRGRVAVWQAAGRLNTTDLLITEEESLRLAARAIEIIRQLDPDTPVVLNVDQPWAEYLSRRPRDFPPLHFADALARSGVGLGGLLMEMNIGYYPGGTLLRDPLEVSRQLDYWAALGLPLHVSLIVPSGSNDDPLASRRLRLPPDVWTPKMQQNWIAHYVPLILAKPYVQGVLWSQLRDSEPHEFPNGGLFDLRRHPKPALRILASIRQAFLR